jgi:hypothetical protein
VATGFFAVEDVCPAATGGVPPIRPTSAIQQAQKRDFLFKITASALS